MDDIDLIWREHGEDGMVYCIPVTGQTYLGFKPARSPFEDVQLGIVETEDPRMLGEPIPVNLSAYRAKLERTYEMLAELDRKYESGAFTIGEPELAMLYDANKICEAVISLLQTSIGHV